MEITKDPTAQAVDRQLKAMGCDRYEIGVRDRKTGKMLSRQGTAEQVKQAVPWMRRANVQGNDIYIRPAPGSVHGLVLVDHIDKGTLDRMRENGHAPAVAVETSPGNYQAWVKAGNWVTDEHRKEISRRFTKEYGADPDRTYGRLGGFTNRKEEHMDTAGRRPRVLVHDSNGLPARKGSALIKMADERVKERVEKSRGVDRQSTRSSQAHDRNNDYGRGR